MHSRDAILMHCVRLLSSPYVATRVAVRRWHMRWTVWGYALSTARAAHVGSSARLR